MKGYNVLDTPEEIEAFRRHALYGALSIEVKTGMKRSSRGPSTLRLVNRTFGTNHKTKKAALSWMEEQGYGSK